MEKWFVASKKADFESWGKKFHISPVTARIIRNRDVETEGSLQKFLYGALKDLYNPMLLHDMDKAVRILKQKVSQGKYIRIIGDYDVDGICASQILKLGLKGLGATVDVAIPHRIKDGYGLSEQLVQDAYEDGVDTILTCDNGIAAYHQIAYAKEKGMTVVVTDHHEVPFEGEGEVRREILPPADAVVDPKKQQCNYPFPGICGAVVAYKLIQALYESEANDPEKYLKLQQQLLQFAAIATICDVMELLDENRIIVKEGLKCIKENPVLGLQALAMVSEIELKNISAYHMGFVIGPCLNATGRLDSAVRSLELFDTTDKRQAMEIAGELKSLNDSRKQMTEEGVNKAIEILEREQLKKDLVLVVFLPECHESLAGIIAGRIREKYGKPTFVLTKAEEGVKGSGRSIETYHMFEALVGCKHLLTKFGGHKMAAGLSLPEENILLFRETINKQCALTEEDFVTKIHIDVPMPLALVNKSFARELEVLEPHGVGNPKPLFARKEVHIVSARKMGAKGQFARLTLTEDGREFVEAVCFSETAKLLSLLEEKYGADAAEKLFSQKCDYQVSITYQVGIQSFRGKENVQILLQNFS
ncbi:MAG: single-stranded-DNA-specific exonuclease RecJ [Lachnospiraceae bacterium]|nr:single-stranded-DNA-specific exonuclease RecJ [Lachnospiraceae bacterium]